MSIDNVIVHTIAVVVSAVCGGILFRIYMIKKESNIASNQISINTDSNINTNSKNKNCSIYSKRFECPDHKWIEERINDANKKFESIDKKQDSLCNDFAKLREELHVFISESKLRMSGFDATLITLQNIVNKIVK